MDSDPWSILKTYKFPLIIIGLGCVVFFNMLFNGFVWDDVVFIVNNDLTHSFNLPLLLGHNVFNAESFFRPLAAVYFASMYTLFGANTFPFHVVQVFLHIINTFLVFFLLKKFFQKNTAFLLSLFFLVHPMQTESISYISTIIEPLFFFFGLSGFLFVISKKSSVIVSFTTGILFLFALLAKETAIIFIFLAIVYTFLLQKKKLFSSIAIGIISIIVYTSIRLSSVGFSFTSFMNAPIALVPFSQRIFSIPLIFFHYIQTFFFPWNLAIDQQWVVHSITPTTFFVPLIVDLVFLGIVGLVGIFVYKKGKKDFLFFSFFFLWFILGIGLILQIFPLDMTVADRWFYFPMVGLLGMLGVNISRIKNMRYIWAIGIVILAFLSIRTMLRNTDWFDPFTLYSRDAVFTQSFDLENNLATEFEKRGDHAAAIIHEKKSVEFFPGEINTNNLAVLLEHHGDFVDAKKYFVQSFSLVYAKRNGERHYPNSYISFAAFLVTRGDPHEALTLIKKGLQEYPKLSNLWMYKAVAYYRLHEDKNAITAIQTSYTLYPDPQAAYVAQQIQKKLPIQLTDTYDMHPVFLQ